MQANRQFSADLCEYLLKKSLMENFSFSLCEIPSYLWSAFSCIETEYGDLLRKPPYSVRIKENTDQK